MYTSHASESQNIWNLFLFKRNLKPTSIWFYLSEMAMSLNNQFCVNVKKMVVLAPQGLKHTFLSYQWGHLFIVYERRVFPVGYEASIFVLYQKHVMAFPTVWLLQI